VKMDGGSWDMEMWDRRGEVRAKKRTVVYIGREWDSSAMTLATVRLGWKQQKQHRERGRERGRGRRGRSCGCCGCPASSLARDGEKLTRQWHVLPWRRFEPDSAWSEHNK
jgi:hypothetical protein